MRNSSPFNRVFWQRIKNLGKEGRSLRQRLFIFSMLFLMTLLAAVFVILLICGVFNIGERETKILLENDLNHISDDIYNDYGIISFKSVDIYKE